MERILFAVDAFDECRKGVPLVTELGKTFGAEVVVFHVRERVINRAGAYEIDEPDQVTVADDIATELKSSGVDARSETIMSTGHVAERIIDFADTVDADLIAMGTRGLADFAGFLMGSVAHKVLHVSKKPVLILK
ncbi:MAG: universal stress protein [Actinomycetota bacterium]|nr:universal stress protein [Actinomycetota bacterium]